MRKMNVLLAGLIGLSILVSGCASPTAAPGTGVSQAGGADKYAGLTVKLGVQGSSGMFRKARDAGWFEDAFGKLGVKVEWAEFQSGPPMTEAMASNRLDFAGLGNMPVIAAQAADIKFSIISQALEGTNNVAIIVPKGSAIQSIDQLKGKKVAVAKGSNAFNFLYRGLEQAGLKASELEIIQLQPDEAQPAFEAGKVDAWATWDPSITLNTLTGKATVLADGAKLGVLSPSFYIVRQQFADKYPELVTLYLKVLEQTRVWEAEHTKEAYEKYAGENKAPAALIEAIYKRSPNVNIPVTKEVIAELQKTADFQYSIQNIRKQVDVSKIVHNQYLEEALKQAAQEPKK
ncbi:aliphatic sulfonate ABC transporter substrate-binding protein [Paenibacillus filicis]|uniref:Aliphatic sulfonate ABC transporter substrate-binding protein n=1 Tax=Paenibacillus filicis TaxID=669464 RepID=A0ABU9DDT3_9BACL